MSNYRLGSRVDFCEACDEQCPCIPNVELASDTFRAASIPKCLVKHYNHR